MPESLAKKNRLKEITFVRLNPFTQLANLLSMKSIKRLLISAFLLWIPNGSLQAVFHNLHWILSVGSLHLSDSCSPSWVCKISFHKDSSCQSF